MASDRSSPDHTFPLPGRLNQLRAVFESQSPAGPSAASTPSFRSSSPLFGNTSQTSGTVHGNGSTSYASRPSSPSEAGTGSSGSYTGPDLLSPPFTRPTTTSGFRSTTSATTRTGTESSISPSYTATTPYTATSSNIATPSYTATPPYTATVTPSAFSGTNFNTWSNVNTRTRTGYTTPNLTSNTYSDTGTFTRTSVTPPSGLRRPQTSPRSPLASVRNIVALWKERTPSAARPGEKSAAESVSSVSPSVDTDGLRGVRRRVEGARARLRETRAVSNPPVTPTRLEGDSTDNGRNNLFPSGIDTSELTGYAKSKDPPIHIGLLWYLNVHASPPYRWQRCQALLYPHMLLLSWLVPGGGRGIVALDLLNCTKAQSAYSPMHPLARDDVGTLAASQQTNDRDGQSLMDTLVPFQMLYADGVEHLAAESLLERQRWVNRIMDSIHPPIQVPDSASVTRSPTGSIRTILSIDSNGSLSSNGSRSTVFVPPLSTSHDISDFQSNSFSVSRQSSFASSYRSQTMDDSVIQNQDYVYRGDPRVITPSRGNSMRRSGSMTDLDEAFKTAISRARGAGPFGGSPVTISSGSTLGKNIFVTPPPSIGRLSGSDRPRSDGSNEHFVSAGSTDGLKSNVSSTYFSQTPLTSSTDLRTATNLRSDTLTTVTTANSETQVPTTAFSPSSYRLTESGSFRSGDSDISFADSPSTLSRTREIRRRVAGGTSRSHSSGYQTDASQSNSSDKENDQSMSGGRTPAGSYTYTPISGSASLSGRESESGSYSDSRSRTPSGSERSVRSGSGSYASSSGDYSGNGSGNGSYTPRSGSSSRSDSFTPASGSYTPGSGSYTPRSGGYTSEGGNYTLQEETSSVSGVGVPLSSCETGYDICPSSDFTDFTSFTTELETVTPITRTSDTLSDMALEKYVTASMGSTEFLTAVVQSSRASITSFESFLSIPGSDSEYATANSSTSSDYQSALEPAKSPRSVSPESVYITADTISSELGDIPSEVSTPTLSSLRLGSEPDEIGSVIGTPSVVPIKSPTVSLMSELLPEEIPLPASLHSPSTRTPSIEYRSPSPFVHISPPGAASVLSDLSPEEVPLPASLHSPSTRTRSVESRSPPTPFVQISSPVVAASVLSELLPEEVPLPASVGSPSIISDLISDLSPEEIPLPASVRGTTDRPLPPPPSPPAAVPSGFSVRLSPLPSTSVPLPPLPVSAVPSVLVPSIPSVPSVPLSMPFPPPLSPSAATIPFILSQPSTTAHPSASISSLSSLSVVQPSPPSPSPSLPPLPLSTPSASLVLSPTPPPLESSVEVSDVRTPSSFHMPTTSLSSPDDGEDSEDELTFSSSLLPTLPDSTLGSTSVITPSSVAFSSVSTASSLPPSTLVISPSPVLSMSTISSSRSLSSFTQTSSSALPRGPRPWGSVSNFSYESSVLQPSPSVQSIALQEVDVSFETSFLRPSGSPSSLDRMSTIPGSPSPLTSAPPQSPLQPLTSVPVLPSSVSSSFDVATPTSISLSSDSSSSLGRTISTYSSSSFVSQSSLSSSVFDSRSLQFEDLEAEPELQTESDLSISTETSISLLPSSASTPRPLPMPVPSLHSSPTTMPSLESSTSTSISISSDSSSTLRPSDSTSPLPSSMPVSSLSSSSMITPEVSLAVSLTTPQGSGDTQQSSLRTVPSVSTVTERDLGRDIDRLADELRTYDHARGLETQDVVDNVRALRQELQDLADFLHRTPSPPTPVVRFEAREETPTPHRTVPIVDASVGRTTSMSSVSHYLPLPPAAPTSLSRATSNASSFNSYLSSHHSDDNLYDEPIYPLSIFDDDVGGTFDSPTSSGSSSLGPSSAEWLPAEPLPLPPETPLVERPLPLQSAELSDASTIRPSVDLLHSLGNIRDQLRDLENGQDTAHDLLMSLLRRREDPTVELADRLRRIEDLVQALVDQGHPRGPEITQDVPPPPLEPASSFEPEGSVSGSESLGYLGSLLGRLTRDGPFMPIPVTARQEQTMVQQLDEILSSADQIPVVGVEQPPNVDPFIYRPVERGQRARSESPVSFSLPLRPGTVPLVVPPATYSGGRPHRPSRRPLGRREITSEEDFYPASQTLPQQPLVGTQGPQGPQMDTVAQQPLQQQQAIRRSIPIPGPVIPEDLYDRPPTAPATFGGTGRRVPKTWYLPDQRRQQLPRPTISADIPIQQAAQPQEPNIQRQYVSMPPGPTTVHLPPVFESLMEILRENRLAQLATVDQQRELMRYMRGLNEWLERDVYDRQSELRGVVARVEQLSHDIRGIRAQGGTSSGSDDTSTVYETGPTFPQPALPLLRYPPVIPPVVPETIGFQGPFIPPQAFPQPITVTTLPPRMPPFLPERFGPLPGRRTSEGGSVFIPPDISPASRHSTGEPRPTYPMSPSPVSRPYPSDLGEVVNVPPSPSSSSGASTDPYRRDGSRRDSRRADSRVGDPRRGDSRPTSRSERRHPQGSSPRRSSSGPLMVTNLSEVPEVVSDPYGRHSVSPEASHYEQRPQFQPQPQFQPPQPQQPTPMTINFLPPAEPQMPMMPIPMAPSGASMGMAPSGMPMAPTGGPIPSVMHQTPPVVMMPRSRSSSRGSRVPMAQTGAPMGMAPTGVPMGMAPMGMAPMGMAPMGMPMVPTGGIMHPPGPVIMQPSSRSSSRSSGVPMAVAHSGMPMGVPPSGMPMGMVPTGMPMGMPMGMPPTGMMPMGMPPTGMVPMGMQPMMPPAVVMQPSRGSSRSHRSEHRRTPPASQPVVINTDSRRTPPYVVQQAQPQPPPQVVMMPEPHSPSRRAQSPSRRHSPRDSPSMVLPPAPYPAPMGMLPMGPGMMGTQPMVYGRSSGSRSRSPRRDVPYIVPVHQPTRSHRPYDDDYDSPLRRPRPRPYRDSSTDSYDRRRRSSPRRRHSRSSSPRLHYPPVTGAGPSGVVPILPTHFPTQQPSYYPGQYQSQHPSQHPSHYPSHLRRSHSSSPLGRPPRAGATYERPYSSRGESPGRYESRRRPQTTSPSRWHPPPIDPSHGRPYGPSSRYRPGRRSSDGSLEPVPYEFQPYSPSRRHRPDRPGGDGFPVSVPYGFQRPQSSFSRERPPRSEVIRERPYSPSRRHRSERPGSDGSPDSVPYESQRPQSSFSRERPPRGEVIRGRPYSRSRRHRSERPASDGSPVSVPYKLQRSQSSFSPERPPRVEVIRGQPYSPPRHHRSGRYDPRDSFGYPYDPRGRPSERDRGRVRTPRYVRGRRYSSEYRRPQHHDPYPSSRRYHSVSSERRSPGDSRLGRGSPSGTQFPRDMSVSTGRSPTPVPRRESGPPVSSAIPREDPTDPTLPPTHRPLESLEHEPVIITVPSRSEAAIRRPPLRMLDEEIPTHTPAVTHVGTLADRDEEHDRPIRPIRDSFEDRRHPTFGEGSRRPDSSHQVPYDSRLPSLSSDGGPRRSPRPEVHWVRDDSPVTRPPFSVPTPTQPTTAERPTSTHVPRDATATPFDLGTADDDRGRLEALNDVAERLHSALITAQNSEERREVEFLTQEDRREDEFRRHEGDRQHYFEEGEERRNAESQQRSDGIWRELETRLKALPAPTPIPQSPSRPVSAVDADDISSIRDLAQQAASQHASDVMETIRLEREDAARERETLAAERAQLMAKISEQKDAIISEKDGQIATLEDEIAGVRAELEAERQQRGIENSEIRERDRQEFIERDENIRAQLGDITNLVQDQRDMYEEKKALMDARWEQKEARRDDKDAQMIELRDMVLKIHDDMERDRSKCDDERHESQEGLQKIIEELRAENSQQRELLANLSENWRADCERHHHETLEAVRSTANEQVSFNVQGYLDDFSRALATEVRMLLGEVGRIREERRALQHEIGELLCIKSKYGPGGEFEPDWTPPGQPPGPQPPTDPPIPPIPESTDPPFVRPAWRIYHPRKKKKKEQRAPVPPTAAQPPQAGPSHMGPSPMDRHLRRQVASWNTWRPDQDVVMTPPPVEPTLMVPDRLSPGLFGTPTSSIYDEPGPQRR